MKSWLTASQLADLKIPGLPASKFRVIERARREKWACRKRADRGGGSEYCVQSLLKSLPEGARRSLLKAVIDTSDDLPVPAKPCRSIELAATASPLADWQLRCAEARAALLLEVERLACFAGIEAAIEEVVHLAAAGELRPDLQELVAAANARPGKEGKRALSIRTIKRWRSLHGAGGIEALTPSAPPPAAPPVWGAALLKLYNTPTKRSLAAIIEEDLPAALPEGVPCPDYHAARRFLARVSVVDRERGRHGPNGLLKFKGFKRRSTEGLQPLDVVTADGHSFKADVAHPVHGKPFRPEVCALQDVTTRYVFGWSTGIAESSHVVMDSIRHGVSSLGLFALFYTDNGSGFVAKAMTAEVTGFLSRLGATPDNSLPGRAQSRGKIERLQSTLWKRAARKLPSYSGRDMDGEARRKVVKLITKDLRERGASRFLIGWQDFLDFCTAAVEAYNNRPHRMLKRIRDEATGKLRHQSPAEALKEHRANGWAPATLAPEAMIDLWRPYEIRSTQRGEVRLPWGTYFAQELVPFGGEKVRVGYDVHDGSKVWVRTLDDGRLICVAERDGNVIAEQPASKVEHARQRRAEGRLRLLNQHAEDVRAELGQPLIELVAEEDFSPALQQRQREIEAELLHPIPTAPDAAVHQLETRRTRFLRALDIEARTDAGEPVSAEDERWHSVYSTQPEYRATRHIYEDFGADALEA
ncbi:MAG: transposase [Parvibaculum sp.]|nr:transposase [Parvibaculum sp.]